MQRNKTRQGQRAGHSAEFLISASHAGSRTGFVPEPKVSDSLGDDLR